MRTTFNPFKYTFKDVVFCYGETQKTDETHKAVQFSSHTRGLNDQYLRYLEIIAKSNDYLIHIGSYSHHIKCLGKIQAKTECFGDCTIVHPSLK